jgi:hypothetical protein
LDTENFMNVILNLSKYHREHEKFYSKIPLKQAIELQEISLTLKSLADHWLKIDKITPKEGNPFMGCEDLNDKSTIQYNGVLFMEGESKPLEIDRLIRDLENLANDFLQTGVWLEKAMQASWDAALPLIKNPYLADVLGERHRIITNDWQAANLSSHTGRIIKRAIEIIKKIDFSNSAIRSDLIRTKFYPNYLYSAAELIDRSADLASDSAVLVHDNERRWRVFRAKVKEFSSKNQNGEHN